MSSGLEFGLGQAAVELRSSLLALGQVQCDDLAAGKKLGHVGCIHMPLRLSWSLWPPRSGSVHQEGRRSPVRWVGYIDNCRALRIMQVSCSSTAL